MFHEEVVQALEQAQKLLDAADSADLPGRGRVSIGYRLPELFMPKSDLYELHVAHLVVRPIVPAQNPD